MSSVKYVPSANSVLRGLAPADDERLRARHDQIDLRYGDVLCEPGEPLAHAYFPNSGIISLLTPVTGHASVEAGLVGSEGMAGMALFLDVAISPVGMLVQCSGTAMRMEAGAFRLELDRNLSLQRALKHYLYGYMAQVAQTAACNRLHRIGARLAGRLLMTHDRIKADEFQCTQEFLAHLLGVRRAGITLAASGLQKKKLIRYRRGRITILNRQGLENAACGCYRAVIDICARIGVGCSPL